MPVSRIGGNGNPLSRFMPGALQQCRFAPKSWREGAAMRLRSVCIMLSRRHVIALAWDSKCAPIDPQKARTITKQGVRAARHLLQADSC